MAHKIEAPAGYAVHGPWRYPETNPPDLFWVHGVTYVDLGAMPRMRSVVDGMARRGYTVTTVQTIPADYEQAVELLRRSVQQDGTIRPTTGLQDAVEPGRVSYTPTVPYESA